jgi:hypothetical protein
MDGSNLFIPAGARRILSRLPYLGMGGAVAMYSIFANICPHKEDQVTGHIYKMELHGGYAFLTLTQQIMLWSPFSLFWISVILLSLLEGFRTRTNK